MLRKIEKYEILDEIGHGGMATVFRRGQIGRAHV